MNTNPLVALAMEAVIFAGESLLKEEAPFLQNVGSVMLDLAKESLSVLTDSEVPFEDKKELWRVHLDILKAAVKRCEDEALAIPQHALSIIGNVLLLSVESLLGL